MRIRRFLYLLLTLLSAALLWQIIEVRSQPLPSFTPSIPTLPPQKFFLPAAARPDAAEGETLALAIAKKNPFDSRRGQSNSSSVEQVSPPTHFKVIGVLQDEVALVDSSQEGKVIYAHKGEAVGPYHVQEVTPTSVTLAYGSGQTTVLSLPGFDGAGGLRIEVVPGK